MNTRFETLRALLAGPWRALRARLPDTNNSFVERFAKVQQKFDALSLRERGFIFGGLAAITVIIWDGSVMQALYARERAARSALDVVAPEGADGETALTDLDQLVETEKQLVLQYHRKRDQLDRRAASLIDAAVMPEVLTNLIESTRGLRLVRMANLPVEELRAPVTADTDETPEIHNELPTVGGVPAVAFLHGIEINVEGDFDSVNLLVEAIERQHWRFIWRKVELDAADYPKVNAKIVVATLGLEKYWLKL